MDVLTGLFDAYRHGRWWNSHPANPCGSYDLAFELCRNNYFFIRVAARVRVTYGVCCHLPKYTHIICTNKCVNTCSYAATQCRMNWSTWARFWIISLPLNMTMCGFTAVYPPAQHFCAAQMIIFIRPFTKGSNKQDATFTLCALVVLGVYLNSGQSQGSCFQSLRYARLIAPKPYLCIKCTHTYVWHLPM